MNDQIASTSDRALLSSVLGRLGVDPNDLSTLPFTQGDITAGSETELQVAVIGDRTAVDLPISIQDSSYFSNILRRAHSGEVSSNTVKELIEFLEGNSSRVWENSWVRFPRSTLGPLSRWILENDLRSDKNDPTSPPRGDRARFLIDLGGEPGLRVPISYLLKLALADSCDDGRLYPKRIRQTAIRVLPHFLNDNTSPETLSFHVTPLQPESSRDARPDRGGLALANETARRFLLTHTLVQYSNHAFGLLESGQEATVFFSPQPPRRQKHLNRLISDSFYRELFMSPCLSGWNRGEDKRDYMHLCHEVLSRSHLNAVGKLQEAGLITRNLVVLPSTSHTGLAANGTHVSLGSQKWTTWSREKALRPDEDKRLSDAVIKIVEHFLPLFVDRYSAAPSRLDYREFHPETALGFLPHELDFTHLRMLWRRWKKKAKLRFMGKSFTPWGPTAIDNMMSRALRLRGDLIPDRRLLEYPVALLSTHLHSPLDGSAASESAYRSDLQSLGVFDVRMSTYLPYKRRSLEEHGFSGFEARHYSLFHSLRDDLGPAVDLQALLNAVAVRWLANGQVLEADLPSDPESESERRQVMFACAVGIPTFFVHEQTQNAFLESILSRTEGIRKSRRYPGYRRVRIAEYLSALVDLLREEYDLIRSMNLEETFADLERRVSDPETSVSARLLRGQSGNRSEPLRLRADEFETRAEEYYRESLLEKHLREGMASLRDRLEALAPSLEAEKDTIEFIVEEACPIDWVDQLLERRSLKNLTQSEARRVIHLLLWVESHVSESAAKELSTTSTVTRAPEGASV